MRALIGVAVSSSLALVLSVASAAPAVPRGKRAPRPRPTSVVVRATEMTLPGGVTLRVAPGVPVTRAAGGQAALTLLGDVEVTGKLPAAALGMNLARDVDLGDGKGAVVGTGRAGAPVRVVGRAGTGVWIEPVAPIAPVGGRFLVDADAVTAEPRELVLPANEYALLATQGPVTLALAPRGGARAQLPAGARVEPLEPPDAQGWIHVRTYGAVAVEGWLPRERVIAAEGSVLPEPPSRGLTPNREALVDTPLYVDAAGRRPVGTLRGGALVTIGVEVSGPRVKLMTHGAVVGELWAAAADLRPLDASVWAEGR